MVTDPRERQWFASSAADRKRLIVMVNLLRTSMNGIQVVRALD
jgi:hypothetical protein